MVWKKTKALKTYAALSETSLLFIAVKVKKLQLQKKKKLSIYWEKTLEKT